MNPLPQFKKISILPVVIALALVALASLKVVRADAVTDWNAIASTAIVTNAGQPPPVSALSFAMVQGAVYDAVNAIDRGYQPYLVQPSANPTDSKEAAAAAAAFRVLVGFPDLPGLFPAQRPTWRPDYAAYIANLPDNPPGSRAAGVSIGETTARAMLEERMNDGRFGPPPDLYPPAPGIWRPTPPNFANDPAPWVGNVLPFLVPSAEMLRTDGPNALTSADYAEDFNEVKELGSLTSTTRTADQTDAAIFWQDHAIALYNRIFRTLAAKYIRASAQELSRHRQARRQRLQQHIVYPEHPPPTLRRAEAAHRHPSVRRHSRSHRRHARSRARQDGRPHPQEALLPSGP